MNLMELTKLNARKKVTQPINVPPPQQIKVRPAPNQDEITTNDIIDKKLSVKIVREFMRFQISLNCDEDDLQFELNNLDSE